VSEQTVGRVCRDAGLIARKARRKPYLDKPKKKEEVYLAGASNTKTGAQKSVKRCFLR
jgi:hypothetical protein